MLNDKNLIFVKGKIEDLGAAIFHCHSKGLLKIPNTVIETHNVDENGDILFFVNRPIQRVSEFEQEFPIGLDYFKKGRNYSMKIFGKARIVNDAEELTYILHLTPEDVKKALNEQILIKVKILKVDFYENRIEKKNNLLKKVQLFLYDLLDWGEPGARSYDFSTNAALQQYGY